MKIYLNPYLCIFIVEQIILLLQKSSSSSEDNNQRPHNMVRDWIDWIDSVMSMHISNVRSYDHIKQIGRIWSVYTSVARREMELQKKNSSNNETNSAIIGKEDE